MADDNRTLLNRAVALLAGPFVLGQRALSLVFSAEPDRQPSEVAIPIPVTPPEQAIKRRG